MLEHLNPRPSWPERVVVLGAGGFVGGTIERTLSGRGANAVGLTRREIDLLAPNAVRNLSGRLRGSDCLVFVSAIAPAKTVPVLMQNLRMAEVVCEALAARSVSHLLYVSSDAVYSDDANPVTEDSPRAPSTLHGMMHAARELMLRSAVTAPVAMLRPTLIYGADDPHAGYGPNRFRRQAAAGAPIDIFGEGEEQRDHVHIEDVAELAALIVSHRSSGALNAVTGESVSFARIAALIAAQFGNRSAVVSVPRPGPRPHLLHRFFDITQCRKAFPRFHFTPLEEGLRRSMKGRT